MALETIKCQECGAADVTEFKAGTYVCGHCETIFKHVEPSQGGLACDCGTFAVGRCKACGAPVCSVHSAVVTVGRLCREHLSVWQDEQDRVEQERQQREQAARQQAEAERERAQYALGESIQIISGPLSGFTGPICEINEDASQLKVRVLLSGRETLVDASRQQVNAPAPVHRTLW